jgi:hypothetical protein
MQRELKKSVDIPPSSTQKTVDDALSLFPSEEDIIAYDADELKDLIDWENPIIYQGLKEIMKAAKNREREAFLTLPLKGEGSRSKEECRQAESYFYRHGYKVGWGENLEGVVKFKVSW